MTEVTKDMLIGEERQSSSAIWVCTASDVPRQEEKALKWHVRFTVEMLTRWLPTSTLSLQANDPTQAETSDGGGYGSHRFPCC